MNITEIKAAAEAALEPELDAIGKVEVYAWRVKTRERHDELARHCLWLGKQVEELAEALANHGVHDMGCPALEVTELGEPFEDCICGLTTALARLEGT